MFEAGPQMGSVAVVAVSPDGRTAAFADQVGIVSVYDIADWVHPKRIASEGGVPALAFSPDGQVLASGGRDGVIGQWTASTGALTRVRIPPENERKNVLLVSS